MTELLRVAFKDWRYEMRLSLRDIEKITGISNAYLCQFENGRAKNISLANAEKLFCCIVVRP